MEASVIDGPAPRRRAAHGRLLRLGTDDQLVALFRKGYEEAFVTIHDRYRAVLFASTRQMLGWSNADAEDALQEVFMRASCSLRRDDRPVMLRAWLYRVAHNYCVDQIRRPVPLPCELYEVSRPPHRDPVVEAEQREKVRRLVTDIAQLPHEQRSALLMQMNGLRYTEIAAALGTSVPAVKSALHRARHGLTAAEEARQASCVEIRADLDRAHGRKVRMSGRSRKHLSDCAGCSTYRAELRRVDRTVAALAPSPGLLTGLAKLFGVGGAGSGMAAGGGAAAGGGTVAGGTIAVGASPIAAKVTALVCCAALAGVAGGHRRGDDTAPAPPRAAPPATHTHVGRAERKHGRTIPIHVDRRVRAPSVPVRATVPRPRTQARAIAPSDAAPVSIVPSNRTIVTHRVAAAAPASYTSIDDAAHQTGGAAAPDETPAAAGDPGARDEGRADGATADPDTAAAPDQHAPVTPEGRVATQAPADPAPPMPPAAAAAGATPPAATASATRPAPTGGTGPSTSAAAAPAAP